MKKIILTLAIGLIAFGPMLTNVNASAEPKVVYHNQTRSARSVKACRASSPNLYVYYTVDWIDGDLYVIKRSYDEISPIPVYGSDNPKYSYCFDYGGERWYFNMD